MSEISPSLENRERISDPPRMAATADLVTILVPTWCRLWPRLSADLGPYEAQDTPGTLALA